ncbi:MAG: alpha/beta fold hydrolase [Candidatus Dadabacteria bacterium]|nr:alpha/beta fold hydrolase [Candidatus Dadabacteria bacterium]NIQ16846.1 alpha/beta fold hydrolase [Candidatus Dadabacteria bacterium]
MRYVEQELISIPVGKSKVNALYYKAINNEPEKRETILIHVHGFMGNFLDGSQRFLPPILAKNGYSSIAINTRMANFGLFFGYGILDDTVPQIDGVIKYLQELGYKKIILSGYSLGGSVVLRYASKKSEEEGDNFLSGIVALATPYSMPASIKRRWNLWGSKPSYDEVYEEAKSILEDKPHKSKQDRTILIYKARGNTFRPEHTEIYTYKTWWFLAGPEAETAKGYKQIVNIRIPILLIQGWNDLFVRSNETHELAQIAIDNGNEDVSAFYLNTGHNLEGKEEELADIIIRWLDRRFK